MYKASIGLHEVEVVTGDKPLINSKPVIVDFEKSAKHSFTVTLNGISKEADLVKLDQENKILVVRIEGKKYSVLIKEPVDLLLDKLGINLRSNKKINNLKAPMPGLVLKILAEKGQSYKAGDPLMVLEAMKMENVFKAAADLIVKEIDVVEKQTVEKGQILMIFE